MNAQATSQKSRSRRPRRPTPEEYGEFVQQIDLVDIWLIEANVINNHGPRAPRQAALAITGSEATWSSTDNGFDIRFPYVVRFAGGDEVHAEIKMVFGLRFSSPKPMTGEIFDIFKDVNLPLNTWPFLREFVSNTLGRMGWQPYALPAYKVGGPVDDEANEEATSAGNRRRTRARRGAAGDA